MEGRAATSPKGEYGGGDPGEALGMEPKWQHGMGGAHGNMS